jgi:hypothetical protein
MSLGSRVSEHHITVNALQAENSLQSLDCVAALKTLHWSADGAVGFYRIPEGGPFEELGALDLSQDWESQLDKLSPFLAQNAYFTINTLYPGKKSRSGPTGLPIYTRNNRNMRYLNACGVDLDSYALSFEQAFDRLRLGLGDLPPPHLVVNSGRGLWGLWLLRDTQRAGPLPAYGSTLAVYMAIQAALIERFSALGADRKVKDAARIMRVPASVNSKSGSTVQFYRWLDAPRLALTEFSKHLGIRPRPTSLAFHPDGDAAASMRGRQGAAARWRRALAMFDQLAKIRGEFRQGDRRHAVLIYAQLLRRNHFDNSEILRRCLELRLSPPLPKPQIESRVKEALAIVSRRSYKSSLSYCGMAKFLQVTEQERSRLGDWLDPKPTRNDKKTKQQTMVESELTSLGCRHDRSHWPSTRRMADRLAQQGVSVSHCTVSRIYHVLVSKSLLRRCIKFRAK